MDMRVLRDLDRVQPDRCSRAAAAQCEVESLGQLPSLFVIAMIERRLPVCETETSSISRNSAAHGERCRSVICPGLAARNATFSELDRPASSLSGIAGGRRCKGIPTFVDTCKQVGNRPLIF